MKTQDVIGSGPYVSAIAFGFALLLLLFVPFGQALWKSFHLLDPSRPLMFGAYVGLGNFRDLFQAEPEFWSSLLVTLKLIAATTVQFLLAACLALWFHLLWPQRIPRFLLVIGLTPLLVSETVASLMGRLFLNDQVGVVARWLAHMGLSSGAPLATPIGALFWVCAIDSWRWLVATAILLAFCFRLAPQHEVEASALDGYGLWGQLRYVILPRAYRPMLAVFLLRILYAIRTYDIPEILTGGGPGTATLTVSIFAKRLTFDQQRLGVASADVIVLYVAILLLVAPVASYAQAFRRSLKGSNS